jgi:GTP cyclohydrolase II
LPTRWGRFRVYAFSGVEHLALACGPGAGADADGPLLVRLHSECLTGEVFGSVRCDCGPQLDEALRRIVQKGSGMLIYLRQEGRGIGLFNKIRAYGLQDLGFDTVDANRQLGLEDDLRDYSVAADMLHNLGVSEVELLTNNPLKCEALERSGIAVRSRQSLVVGVGSANLGYLETKRDRMGHLLEGLRLS